MAATLSEQPGQILPDGPVTIARVAELAGVSVPTVSKVVNGHAQVAPETRARVEEVIRQYGLRRKQRRASGSKQVELVFHELEGAYAMEMIRGAVRAASEHGMAVTLTQLHGRQVPGRSWTEELLARRPAGLVSVFCALTAEQRARFASRGIHVVALDPTGEPDHDTPSVGAGNWTGALTATRHLLELGHRRIAAITGPLRVLSSRARLDGYRAALDAAGVPVVPELICEGDFHTQDGLEHGRRLLAPPNRPIAIVTGNDLQALGVFQAAAEADLRIPYDLSVAGFDDLPFTPWTSPPLTTVRQPLADMAAAATLMAIALGRGEQPEQERVEFATRLVVRASTGPPSQAR